MLFDRSNARYVGNLGPVPLYVHPSALVMLVIVGMRYWQDPVMMLMAITVLLLAIILHELGHGMAARAQGAVGVTITLWAFGGLCSSRRDSSKPVGEMIILAAGPAVSFALFGIALLLLNVLIVSAPETMIKDPGMASQVQYAVEHELLGGHSWWNRVGQSDMTLLALFLEMTMLWNLVLGIFNSLPIFPLDGGQFLYQGMTLMRLRREFIHKTSFAISVLFVGLFLAWRMSASGGQIDGGLVYTICILGFLLFNAYVYLRL